VARARELSADRSLPQVVDALLELAGPVVQAGAT
jgi:hypothetical protein